MLLKSKVCGKRFFQFFRAVMMRMCFLAHKMAVLVAADEIRKLSETSSSQSATIGEQISEIQRTIQQSMSEMGESAAKINDSGSALSDIAGVMKQSISDIGAQVDLFTV